jgi:hypothetical protein
MSSNGGAFGILKPIRHRDASPKALPSTFSSRDQHAASSNPSGPADGGNGPSKAAFKMKRTSFPTWSSTTGAKGNTSPLTPTVKPGGKTETPVPLPQVLGGPLPASTRTYSPPIENANPNPEPARIASDIVTSPVPPPLGQSSPGKRPEAFVSPSQPFGALRGIDGTARQTPPVSLKPSPSAQAKIQGSQRIWKPNKTKWEDSPQERLTPSSLRLSTTNSGQAVVTGE